MLLVYLSIIPAVITLNNIYKLFVNDFLIHKIVRLPCSILNENLQRRLPEANIQSSEACGIISLALRLDQIGHIQYISTSFCQFDYRLLEAVSCKFR